MLLGSTSTLFSFCNTCCMPGRSRVRDSTASHGYCISHSAYIPTGNWGITRSVHYILQHSVLCSKIKYLRKMLNKNRFFPIYQSFTTRLGFYIHKVSMSTPQRVSIQTKRRETPIQVVRFARVFLSYHVLRIFYRSKKSQVSKNLHFDPPKTLTIFDELHYQLQDSFAVRRVVLNYSR